MHSKIIPLTCRYYRTELEICIFSIFLVISGCEFHKIICNKLRRRSSLDSRSEILGEESIGTDKTSNSNKEVDEIHVDLLEDERNNDIKQEIRDDDVSSNNFSNFQMGKIYVA